MAKTPNYTKYECDRTNYHKGEGGKAEYLADTDSRRNDWRSIDYVTADGNTVSYLLCPVCAAEYKQLAADQDKTFTAWRTAAKEGE